jgi:hypothetical protein
MAIELTPAQVAEDLQATNDFAEFFGYGKFDEGTGTLMAEGYDDDGQISATYTVKITVEKDK